jgi:molecular chaperone GrpE
MATNKKEGNEIKTAEKKQETKEKKRKETKEKPVTKEETNTEDQLKAEAEEWKDKYVRLAAEFDNYRKRTLNEKLELTKTAGKELLFDFLSIMDDFERAMHSSEDTKDVSVLKEGLNLIFNKCKAYLNQNGVEEIEALNKDFNTDEHEAVTKIPAPDKKKKGKIVDVIQKGYYLNNGILRYAKVIVGE